MKKSLLLLTLLVGLLVGLQAQTLVNEGFDGTTFVPTGWTNIKVTGSDWKRVTDTPYTGAGFARYLFNSTVAANSWLITPSVTLEAGKTYMVDLYELTGGADCTENLKITYGNAATAEAQTNLILDLPGLKNTKWENKRATFTPATSGTYFIGFQCYSDKDQFLLGLDDIIVRVAPTAPEFAMSPVGTSEAPVYFGYGANGFESRTKTFTIRNSGAETLTIAEGGITIVDPNNQYSLTTTPSAAISLAGGQTTTFTVKFAPTSTGVKSASIVIQANARAAHTTFVIGAGYETVKSVTEGFENGISGGWTNLGDVTCYTMLAHSGKNMVGLWFQNKFNRPIIISPRFEDTKNKVMKAWLRDANTSGAALTSAHLNVEFGTMTNPLDSTTFKAIGAPVALTSEYVEYSRTSAIDQTGNYFAIRRITPTVTSTANASYAFIDDINIAPVSAIDDAAIATTTTLSQNYPNPFNPETTISFNLVKNSSVKLAVYNSKGEMVKELVNAITPAGIHNVKFNATNMNSGVYFYKLSTPEKTMTQKMLLVK